jgi:PAS domain S-box-containing protein
MTEIILESISDGVFTVDLEWRITSFNRAAEKITGIRRAQAIGRLCCEVFKSNMCESECPLRRTIRTGKPQINKPGWIINLKGEKIPISVSTALLVDADGTVVGGAETFRDLSELEELRKELKGRMQYGEMTSHSASMRRIFELLPIVAESASTVLIQGETGTGKELLARTIHGMGPRAKGAFVALNCGALPDTLLESELFGYRKGAFTGADKDKPGRFALARGGTLFLDEIGDITSSLQVKLLRVLQEREYEPLGAVKPESTDARIICATNRNLRELVARGEFREDLFYRINVVPLVLPPLRERREDIPHLAERFLSVFNHRMGKSIAGFSSEVLAAFYRHSWPGNIRELENVVERCVVLCARRQIETECLPEELMAGGGAPMAPDTIRAARGEAEKQSIIHALEDCAWNRAAAARRLGIDKATLYRKIRAYGITLPKADGRN